MTRYCCYHCMKEFEAKPNNVMPDLSDINPEVRDIFKDVINSDGAPCPNCGRMTRPYKGITEHILKYARQYFIDQVKAPLRKFIIIIAKQFPVLTIEDKEAKRQNIRNLLELEKWFLECEVNSDREAMFASAWRIIKSIAATDPYYESRLVKTILKARDMEWEDITWTDNQWLEEKEDAII